MAISIRSAKDQPRRQAPELSERRAKLEAAKTFAIQFRCSSRLRDGVIELYSKKRGCWVTVPEEALIQSARLLDRHAEGAKP